MLVEQEAIKPKKRIEAPQFPANWPLSFWYRCPEDSTKKGGEKADQAKILLLERGINHFSVCTLDVYVISITIC